MEIPFLLLPNVWTSCTTSLPGAFPATACLSSVSEMQHFPRKSLCLETQLFLTKPHNFLQHLLVILIHSWPLPLTPATFNSSFTEKPFQQLKTILLPHPLPSRINTACSQLFLMRQVCILLLSRSTRARLAALQYYLWHPQAHVLTGSGIMISLHRLSWLFQIHDCPNNSTIQCLHS